MLLYGLSKKGVNKMIAIVVGFILGTIGWAASGWLDLNAVLEALKNLF